MYYFVILADTRRQHQRIVRVVVVTEAGIIIHESHQRVWTTEIKFRRRARVSSMRGRADLTILSTVQRCARRKIKAAIADRPAHFLLWPKFSPRSVTSGSVCLPYGFIRNNGGQR
jgi:hypothetical protein